VEGTARVRVVEADAAVELVIVDVAPVVALRAAELPDDAAVTADAAQPGRLKAGDRDQSRLAAGAMAAFASIKV
jgi:hypothetical protein